MYALILFLTLLSSLSLPFSTTNVPLTTNILSVEQSENNRGRGQKSASDVPHCSRAVLRRKQGQTTLRNKKEGRIVAKKAKEGMKKKMGRSTTLRMLLSTEPFCDYLISLCFISVYPTSISMTSLHCFPIMQFW